MAAVSLRKIAAGLVGLVGVAGCGAGDPPADVDAITEAVTAVPGVTSAQLSLESTGAGSGWSLRGEIGLPDGRAEAEQVYDRALEAISSEVGPEPLILVYSYGVSASGQVHPDDIGAPRETNSLWERYH